MEIDYIEGKNPVLEALKANREINKILIAKGIAENNIKEILLLAKKRRILVEWVPKKMIEQKATIKANQGILAFVSPINYVEVEDILEIAKSKNEAPFIIILDHLEDPHNFGAILRTAEGVGVHGIIIPKKRSVSVTGTVAKTSAGAIEYLPVARVSNLVQTINTLKENGCWVIGTDAQGDKEFMDADLTGPMVLVVGSEGKGMSRLVKDNCDFIVSIPMVGKINSLNASVATSILLYEIYKQRNISNN